MILLIFRPWTGLGLQGGLSYKYAAPMALPEVQASRQNLNLVAQRARAKKIVMDRGGKRSATPPSNNPRTPPTLKRAERECPHTVFASGPN